jgi:hypothetical protein
MPYFSSDSLGVDAPPSLPCRLFVITLGVRNLEVTNHGTTQSRKAKEGEAQPKAAGIL